MRKILSLFIVSLVLLGSVYHMPVRAMHQESENVIDCASCHADERDADDCGSSDQREDSGKQLTTVSGNSCNCQLDTQTNNERAIMTTMQVQPDQGRALIKKTRPRSVAMMIDIRGVLLYGLRATNTPPHAYLQDLNGIRQLK